MSVTFSARAQAVSKSMRQLMTIATIAFIAPLANPCEEIAVLSHDAKYMLLDGETLATRDVGNLRWMGIWGIDAILPGSTSARFAFLSDSLSAELAVSDESGHFQRSALVAVTNLAERNNTASRIAISHGYEFSLGDARWIDGADQLIVRTQKKSIVTVLDQGLSEVDSWINGVASEATFACRREGTLFSVAGTLRTVRQERESTVDALTIPDGLEDCRMESREWGRNGADRLAEGCGVMLGCRGERGHVKAVVDIAENKVVAWHQLGATHTLSGGRQNGLEAKTYMPSVLLFADGKRLLRQQEQSIPLPDGRSAFRTMPGPLLRTVNTGSGQVLNESTLSPSGTVSRVFCRGISERTVVSGEGKIHLIDLNTLETIASAAIPFERPFVF